MAAITGPEWNLRLCTVHLIDSHLCADPAKYIAALMLSLSSMLHLETPHVNVLSKVDLAWTSMASWISTLSTTPTS